MNYKIYAVDKNYLATHPLTNTSLLEDNNYISSDLDFNYSRSTIENSNPLKSEIIIYKIVKILNTITLFFDSIEAHSVI